MPVWMGMWMCGWVDVWMGGCVDGWMGDIKSISPSIYSLPPHQWPCYVNITWEHSVSRAVLIPMTTAMAVTLIS